MQYLSKKQQQQILSLLLMVLVPSEYILRISFYESIAKHRFHILKAIQKQQLQQILNKSNKRTPTHRWAFFKSWKFQIKPNIFFFLYFLFCGIFSAETNYLLRAIKQTFPYSWHAIYIYIFILPKVFSSNIKICPMCKYSVQSDKLPASQSDLVIYAKLILNV